MPDQPLRISSLLGRRRWWLLAGTLLMMLSLAAGVALLGLSGWFITASALAGLGLLVGLDIFTPGAGIRLAAVVRTVSRYLERLATHEATFRLLTDLRDDLFRRLLAKDELQLKALRRGDTLNRLTTDVNTLDHLFVGVLGPISSAMLLTLGLALALGLLLDPWTALVVAALLIISPLVAESGRRAGFAASRSLVATVPELRREASDSLDGLADLIAYDRAEARQQQLQQLSGRAIGLQEQLARLDAKTHGLVTMNGFLAVWLVLVVGISLFQSGLITGPVLGLAVLATLGLGEAWQGIPAAWRRLEQCRGAQQRLLELTDLETELPQPATPLQPEGQHIRLEGVSFRYGESLPWVLEDVDLQIRPGERVAVVGPSGCGKTTLARLILRQIDPSRGRVLLGEQALTALDTDGLRRHIGLLSQQPCLFHDTVAGNLRLARPQATDEELGRALAMAGLSDFMDGLAQGLDTWIDEAAGNVSGGEARRLALARLMLTDCPVVILDEPTTGLDDSTAGALARTLDQWLSGRTVLMITHDPEILPPFDRLLRLPQQPD